MFSFFLVYDMMPSFLYLTHQTLLSVSGKKIHISIYLIDLLLFLRKFLFFLLFFNYFYVSEKVRVTIDFFFTLFLFCFDVKLDLCYEMSLYLLKA